MATGSVFLNDIEAVQIHKMILQELKLIRQDMKNEIREFAAKMCNQIVYQNIFNQTKEENLNFPSEAAEMLSGRYYQDSDKAGSDLCENIKVPTLCKATSPNSSANMDVPVQVPNSQCLENPGILNPGKAVFNNYGKDLQDDMRDDSDINSSSTDEEVIDFDDDSAFHVNRKEFYQQNIMLEGRDVSLITNSKKPAQVFKKLDMKTASTGTSCMDDVYIAGDKPFIGSVDVHGHSFEFGQVREVGHHSNAATIAQEYTCSPCCKIFFGLDQMRDHMKSFHAAEKTYVCTQCLKCFTKASILSRHMLSHNTEKPYKCSRCRKCFTNSFTLHEHIKLHAGEKPYVCEICSKTFTQRGSLKVHMRVHTGEKPYQCESCSKSFTYVNSFRRHLRSHTEEKPFKCNQCFKSYRRASNLKLHMKIHDE